MVNDVSDACTDDEIDLDAFVHDLFISMINADQELPPDRGYGQIMQNLTLLFQKLLAHIEIHALLCLE